MIARAGHAADFLPGIGATIDLAGPDDPGALCGLQRHRDTLAKGAVRQQPFAGCLCQLVWDVAHTDVLQQLRISHRAAILDAAAAFARVFLAHTSSSMSN
jgi:hypothetical protein